MSVTFVFVISKKKNQDMHAQWLVVTKSIILEQLVNVLPI